ncbi:MAG TPA: glycosyltransferase [Candidatus Margulisiibacteriota bacterium]|nr:glycosyltransferase [Candidatus Margulisiibacteriota bacterium]
MKIFILYVSAGSGHAKAAAAVYEHFKEEPGVELELIDVLSLANPYFKEAYTGLYSFTVRYCAWFWGFCYWFTSLRPLSALLRKINCRIDLLNTRKFSHKLIAENPDLIISTHFLPPEIASHLKKKGRITSRLVTIITDFGAHPYWVAEGVDLYIVPSQLAREQLLGEGVPDKRISLSGIPVAEKFLREPDKIYLRSKLGLKQDAFIVLIVSGSFGIGPIERIVGSLHRDVELLVVCASNKKLYARLTRRNYSRVKVFAFVDNMEELMGASDIIVTKPGGLTIAELLSLGLPPLFITAIPGQESQNIKFLSSIAIGLDARKLKTARLRGEVLRLKNDPGELMRQRVNIVNFRKRFSPEALADVIR